MVPSVPSFSRMESFQPLLPETHMLKFRGPAAMLFISRDTYSDSMAKLSDA